jgi:hypothetical protein
MGDIQDTIEGMLDANGQLRLTRQPRLPPGPVRVTIRTAAAVGPQRGLADVVREIAAEQRSRGFPGRSAEELRAEEEARLTEDAERDRELDAARRTPSPGRP